MFKLMQLEIKKMSLGWYIKGAIVANLLILVLLWFIPFIEEMEEGISIFADTSEAILVAGIFVRATFIVFAAVLLAKLVIEEYKDKTISVLFTYPTPRKKLMGAKLLLTVVITFITIVLSQLFVVSAYLGLNLYFQFTTDPLTLDMIQKEAIRMLVYAVAITGSSLIPLYFGMRKKSVSATIISSMIVVTLVSSHNPMFSLATIIYIPLSLAILGVLMAFWSIRRIEEEDIV